MSPCFRDIDIRDLREETLTYADDAMAVVINPESNLQRTVDKWNRGTADSGMKILTAKGKTEFKLVS